MVSRLAATFLVAAIICGLLQISCATKSGEAVTQESHGTEYQGKIPDYAYPGSGKQDELKEPDLGIQKYVVVYDVNRPDKNQDPPKRNHSIIPSVVQPNPDEWPIKFGALLIWESGDPVCSASIISRRFVLTSCSKCVLHPDVEPILDQLTIGVPEFMGDNALRESILNFYDIKRVVVHPKCYPEKYKVAYDIGIIETHYPIIYDVDVRPAKVPSRSFKPNHNVNWMISSVNPQLMDAPTRQQGVWFVKVQAACPDYCSMKLNSTIFNSKRSFCSGYVHENKFDETCRYDYGAPLSYNDRLLGILTYKKDCGKQGELASFVSVPKLKPWIQSVIRDISDTYENI